MQDPPQGPHIHAAESRMKSSQPVAAPSHEPGTQLYALNVRSTTCLPGLTLQKDQFTQLPELLNMTTADLWPCPRRDEQSTPG